jgi:predicted nucleotidyltransferase
MLKIGSKIEGNLLRYFFLNDSEERHLREIARIIGADPANLDKKLQSLTKLGLFQVKKRGNQSLYSLNKSFFLFNEYKSIISKTYGVEHQIKEALKRVSGIKKAFIFGSYAKGGFDRYSDIDLLVVGEQDGLKLSTAVTEVERKTGREINVVEIDSREFLKPIKPFIKHILSEKMIEILL